MIAGTAATIEAALALQVKRSDQLYSEFIIESSEEPLSKILDQLINKMARGLSLPHQCLTIACIYINRAVA